MSTPTVIRPSEPSTGPVGPGGGPGGHGPGDGSGRRPDGSSSGDGGSGRRPGSSSPAGGGSTSPAVTGAELAVIARRELVSTPVGDLDTAVEVLERLNKLQVLGTFLQRGMEAMTSLRSSQFMILKAIECEVDHPRHIGRKVGMETGAVELTLVSLREKGLVTTRSDRGHVVAAALTDTGRAILTQAEAMQIRATDALLQRAEPSEVAEVLDLLDRAVESVHAIIGLRDADEDLAARTGATGSPLPGHGPTVC
ncbi:MarR family winged helix-turn-helix transcriptional regulator [Sanguibacter sp. 4.1]|uniref:MarR family winged helix-turn-helix transcriptional regulator n=1 Tax=Sanguibacter biliveldensis TaxID=3030830 RepID=A0AAF0Z3P4_9MICO|nr:MarR family winged helix-turn-helix transcriptional regulator [Sanguibacter sp. 4.1]WPF82257.1 MarR family winged helix-turn-helix transcriptional regulator [Sanguibacter sp. 4.1]